MKKNKKTLSAILLTLTLLLSIAIPGMAAETGQEASSDIVILYTNDIHTHIDGTLNYATVASMKQDYASESAGVLLVDCGDHIQGTAYGSMDDGATIIELMNAAGYDLATLGNHEFDYGMDVTLGLLTLADFPYVSCNFYQEVNGIPTDNVLDSYQIFEVGELKIAFVGITTPESIIKSTPSYFMDEEGNYIYGIAGGADGAELYEAVQTAIDAAAQEADLVIALGHLGDDPSSDPWNSEDVIANTTGLSAFIDGHSHSTVESKAVADKDGNTVILTQTGSYFAAIGVMTISADGSTISTELITEYADEAASVKDLQDDWINEVDTLLNVTIGSFQDTMDNYDDEGNRLVRSEETNTGDFVSDALYYLFESMDLNVDVAIMNGGGIRNEATTGEITYMTCKTIHPFGNVACLIEVTGQQLLDALEWGAQYTGAGENGGFLHTSGLKYTINTAIESTVQKDENGVWTGGPTGEYRVTDVQIYDKASGEYVALDLNATYNLAGYNYTLRNLGDGFAMFDGAVNILDYVMEDYMVLANYVLSFENGVVTGYETSQGRITILH